MRDLVVFVADSTMEIVFNSFLSRADYHEHYNLNIRPIAFKSSEDLIRVPGNDPGVYGKGHEWVRERLGKHRHAVVVFDREFGTNLDADTLRDDLTNRILQTGWEAERFRVIVIDPELEAWMWQRNQKVATPLGFASVEEMVNSVIGAGLPWPNGHAKPARPKEALEAIARKRRIGWSAAIHRSITTNVSLVGCQDPTFLELRQALQLWFPRGAPQ
ncbi:MAG: hypothetical protein IH606_07100 [Burkholderiales bacterium]|nr:hypothetical protein [Burkholderiales bacterium]